MRFLGHLCLWAGFLSAAFWSVSQLELENDPWMTIPWWKYGLSMAVGIAGIVMLRVSARRIHTDETKTEAAYSVLEQKLAQLVAQVGKMCKNVNKLQPVEIVHSIDEECVEPFAEFADARRALILRFGLQVYAEVMTQFASGERYVNRAWSAAADGYKDEAAASLDRANEHLQKAQQLMQSAAKA